MRTQMTPPTHGDDAAFPGSQPGLTKREYFAAMALQGLLADGTNAFESEEIRYAVAFADALIEALNRKN